METIGKIYNEILLPKNSFVPMGEKIIPVEKTKSKHFIPEYARFKAGLWNHGYLCCTFPSYECAKNMTEEQGYDDLMKRVIRGKNPDHYESITLYMSITDELKVKGKNHNFEVCCYAAGRPVRTERKIIFDGNGKVNIEKTIEINNFCQKKTNLN
jgi:hypothetical protein